jgi:DNA-binding NtrC family response regulator
MSTSGNSTIRVLHVDDDPDIVNLASTFLEREDDSISVESATSAEEALEDLESANGEIDCVISDYTLPNMESVTFLERVHDSYPELPFILFTGRDTSRIDDVFVETEMTAYHQKGAGTEQYAALAEKILSLVERYESK